MYKTIILCLGVPALLLLILTINNTLGIILLLFIVFTIAFFALEASTCKLDDKTLAKVIQCIDKNFDTKKILSKKLESDHVMEYYETTTNRDYRILEWFEGPGMHSKLTVRHPINAHSGLTVQPSLVMREIAASHAQSVLEVGSGKGFCTFYLANLLPDVRFTGLDLVHKHIEISTVECSRGNYKNVRFVNGDARDPTSFKTVYDIIFSVEALCHLDSENKMRDFLENTKNYLHNRGKLVIVDGFRSPDFNTSSENQQLAMMLAERGFQIKQMPSKADWILLASEYGLEVQRDVDLTEEVLPFWRLGWRVARFLLHFMPLTRFFHFSLWQLLSHDLN